MKLTKNTYYAIGSIHGALQMAGAGFAYITWRNTLIEYLCYYLFATGVIMVLAGYNELVYKVKLRNSKYLDLPNRHAKKK